MIADSPQSICGGRALNEAILARQAAGRRHRRDRQHLSGAAEPLRADRRQEKEANRDAVHKAIGDFLYDERTGLPLEHYTDPEVDSCSDEVFRHVFRTYPTAPSPYYQTYAA